VGALSGMGEAFQRRGLDDVAYLDRSSQLRMQDHDNSRRGTQGVEGQRTPEARHVQSRRAQPLALDPLQRAEDVPPLLVRQLIERDDDA